MTYSPEIPFPFFQIIIIFHFLTWWSVQMYTKRCPFKKNAYGFLNIYIFTESYLNIKKNSEFLINRIWSWWLFSISFWTKKYSVQIKNKKKIVSTVILFEINIYCPEWLSYHVVSFFFLKSISLSFLFCPEDCFRDYQSRKIFYFSSFSSNIFVQTKFRLERENVR